jgi:hypothetical protein
LAIRDQIPQIPYFWDISSGSSISNILSNLFAIRYKTHPINPIMHAAQRDKSSAQAVMLTRPAIIELHSLVGLN